MSIIIGEGAATADYKQSTKDLCQALLDDPELKETLKAIDTFMADDSAKELFSAMQSLGETLQTKQQAGLELSAGEVEEYNKARDAMLDNPTARGFVDAQEAIGDVHQYIGTAVSMVFELGRMPTDEELSGCCGGGGGGG